MSCDDCESEQASGGGAYYYWWGAANIAILGCSKHVGELIDALNKKHKAITQGDKVLALVDEMAKDIRVLADTHGKTDSDTLYRIADIQDCAGDYFKKMKDILEQE